MTRALWSACLIIAAGAIVAQTAASTIFKARAEAVSRIDASRQNLTDPQAQAEMALHWAEAMDRAAHAIPSGDASKAEPYASWLQANDKYLVYDEPDGAWMLRRDTILNLHRMYASMAAADDIAWLLVSIGIDGECEGYLPCYAVRQDLTNGEYLRLHADGRHSDEAMRLLREWIGFVLHDEPDVKKMFVPAEQCGELKKSVSMLRAAVAHSRAYRHDDVERGLDELLGWCR